jgi:hypothetical protein
MFRKLMIALGATAVIATTALAPTAASAKHWHHHHNHWFHGGVAFYPGPYAYAAPDCYIVKRVVWTPWGKRIRRVEVCD